MLQEAAPALRPHAPSPRAVRTRGLEVDAVKLCGTFVNPAYGPFRFLRRD
ncbi:MAG TPA: hypothetical protein VFZ09_07840 [Archangium sp.]|nr:hypothetical protein [Archangium sp.]HEX5746139.1 hypothetical protein [Archangium sp.]